MANKCLMVGCGYVGLPLALRLMEQGNEVTGWVHSEESAAALKPYPFARIITGSVGARVNWDGVPEKFDLVIHCASSGRGGSEAYKEVFLFGVDGINRSQSGARRLFVSSTSLYSQNEGESVTEESPAESRTDTGRVLNAADQLAKATGFTVIRSAGIYGPGRGVLFEKLRQGTAVLEGDGSRWLNQIHRDDLIAAILHLVDHGKPGEAYNATDGTPVTLRDYYTWCSDFLKVPMPPTGPVDPNRKRGLTSKRVSNAKLRMTGWTPRYPSFREGLTADHSPR